MVVYLVGAADKVGELYEGCKSCGAGNSDTGGGGLQSGAVWLHVDGSPFFGSFRGGPLGFGIFLRRLCRIRVVVLFGVLVISVFL